MLDEQGFGDDGTHAAGAGQSSDRREQVQKKDGQIAHATMLTRSRQSQEMLAD